MMKKKKKLSLALSSVITIGILGSVPAFAATNPSATVSQATGTPSGEKHEGHQKGFKDLLPPKMSADQLKKKAEKLGIKTSGKDTATLSKKFVMLKSKKKQKNLGSLQREKIRTRSLKKFVTLKSKKKQKNLGSPLLGKIRTRSLKKSVMLKSKKKQKNLGSPLLGKIQKLLQKKFVMPVFLKMLKS